MWVDAANIKLRPPNQTTLPFSQQLSEVTAAGYRHITDDNKVAINATTSLEIRNISFSLEQFRCPHY